MLDSLGKELSREDFLASALGSQHVFVIIQASDTKRPLVVRWPDLLKAILAQVPSNPGGQSGVQVQDEGTVVSTLAQFLNFVGAGVTVTPNGLGVDITIPGGAPGSAQWGSIGAGTGVGSQTDLVAYLATNFYPLAGNPSGFITSAALAPYLTIAAAAATYYPLSNPSGFITAAALVPYLTSAIAASTYVPLSRTITINGVTLDLSANRSWTIPGGGTVTSVGLSVPTPSNPAFSVVGSPITTSGTLQIQANGTPAQYVRGDMSLAPFPDIPSPTAVYPYGRRQIYGTGDHRAIGFYQDKLFVVNNTANQVRVIDVPTNAVLLTTTVNLANTSQIIDDIAVAEHWCTSTGGTFIARHNAVSGAFIASTTPTGVVTNAQQSRFASFDSVKSIGTNLTNVYTINPNTFVTANLSAHGLGGLMTYLAINKNPSSLQNGLAMIGGQIGIILFNCNTNAIVLAATNLSGLIGNVLDVAYDSVNDFWFIATLVGGVFRVVVLQPASATTFTTVYTILAISSNDFTLTGGNAKQVSIVPIPSFGQLHICVNQQVFIYNILTGAILKSQYIYSFAGTVRPTYGVLDAPGKRYFFCTGGAGAAVVQELIYDE